MSILNEDESGSNATRWSARSTRPLYINDSISRYAPELFGQSEVVQGSSPGPDDESDVIPETIMRSYSTIIAQDTQDVIQPTHDPNAFDPQNFDPMNLTFSEVVDELHKCSIYGHYLLVKDALLRFSLIIEGVGACAEKDLMIATYLYLEKFDVQAEELEFCFRFDETKHKDEVAVVFTHIQTAEDILTRAESDEVLKNKVRRNEDFQSFRRYAKSLLSPSLLLQNSFTATNRT